MTTIDQPEYFARLAEVESNHWWSRGLWKLMNYWLDHALRGRNNLLALDVGCGAGGTLGRLTDRQEIRRAIGVEPSPHALALAKGEHPLAQGSILNLPFEDETFDVVTCLDVLQHLERGMDEKAVQELARVLRPGGIALVRSNAKGFSRVSNWYVNIYELNTLKKLFDRTGLTVRRGTLANCLPAIVQEGRERLARLRKSETSTEVQGLCVRVPAPWLNRAMLGVATAEAFVAGKLGRRLPFGHSTLLLLSKKS